MEKEKTCVYCGENFLTNHSHKKYCTPNCQVLHSTKIIWEEKRFDITWRLSKCMAAAKNRSKTKNLNFDLDILFLEDLFYQNDGCCALTGIKFDLSSGEVGQPNKYGISIDRIIPEFGYIKTNVRLITFQMNMAMADYGEENFEKLAIAYLNYAKGIR